MSVLKRELEEGYMTSIEYEELKHFVRKCAVELAQTREFNVQQLIEEYDLPPDWYFIWMQLRALVNQGLLEKAGRGYFRRPEK